MKLVCPRGCPKEYETEGYPAPSEVRHPCPNAPLKQRYVSLVEEKA